MHPGDVPFEAVNQRGLFTRRQAYGDGWTPRQVRRRLDAGRWKVVAGAALAAASTPIGAWELAQAVVLTWPGAVVSHRLAGALHGLPLPTALLGTATVPQPRGLRAQGLLSHRVPLSEDEVEQLGRIAVTTYSRTCLDLLASLPWDDARSLFAWLVTRGRFGTADVEATLASRRHRVGTAQLRRLVAVTSTGSLSAAEDRLHASFRSAGLRGWQANAAVVVRGRVIAVVDILFAAARLVIEIDGFRAHSSREAFQRDRVRQNDLVAAGYLVLRFTWEDVDRRPAQVLDRIRAALAERLVAARP